MSYVELRWTVEYSVERTAPIAKVTLYIPTEMNGELPRQLCNRNLPLMNSMAIPQWGDLVLSDTPDQGYRYQSKVTYGVTWDDIQKSISVIKQTVYDQIREILRVNTQELEMHQQLRQTQPVSYEETVALTDIIES